MNEVIEQQPESPSRDIRPASTSPADLVQMAVERGASIEQIERLMNMRIQWEAHEAKKAYVDAMAEFKKNPPEIIKNKEVAFGDTRYMHATIGHVAEKIVAALAEHGFSHRWIPGRTENGNISVTCEITHRQGHSERTTLDAPADQSGKKNNIQAMISTKTYLERHSLLAAVGLATKDQDDDDGAAAEINDADISLREKWIAYARSAPTLTDLDIVWKKGAKEIHEAGTVDAYNAFKAEVQYLGKRFKGDVL
ncbi:ERF family protein [Robbsia andropogonis]|uniref:ERF family protein n=1 Tax=Robbsia andropogonis TaxID=28092 RepID=UPI00209FB469|nr:ERF family protein [Robbsia andropogonis]MCP1118894.1 ERF family protein [Robbsia andropogonis]MCP1128361.1 ERF family protein [Robbsia andropogonis]